MKLKQNDREHLVDMVQRGEMTADQANVEKVRAMRVQLVTSRIPAQVRKALNEAVKRGELGHMKKDGRKPEAYYHPTFDYLARQERNEHERQVLNAVAGVLTRASDVYEGAHSAGEKHE
jgi:bifunctional pyridoxal-dependent enzyme with beta-cystathionase and maltose regulon repressor activities